MLCTWWDLTGPVVSWMKAPCLFDPSTHCNLLVVWTPDFLFCSIIITVVIRGHRLTINVNMSQTKLLVQMTYTAIGLMRKGWYSNIRIQYTPETSTSDFHKVFSVFMGNGTSKVLESYRNNFGPAHYLLVPLGICLLFWDSWFLWL